MSAPFPGNPSVLYPPSSFGGPPAVTFEKEEREGEQTHVNVETGTSHKELE